MMMTINEAMGLLQSFEVGEGHDWDRHCITVGEIGFRLADELKKFIEINPDEVRVLGILHDIGRGIIQDPYGHSYEGHRLMMSLGHPDIARICTCHSNGTYKQEDLEEYGLQPKDFFVTTMEEKLIFMADNMESKGNIIRNDARIYATIERYKKTNPEFVSVLLSKLDEFKAFDLEIKKICGKATFEILGI